MIYRVCGIGEDVPCDHFRRSSERPMEVSGVLWKAGKQTLPLSSPSAPSAFAVAFLGGMLKMVLVCCVVVGRGTD